jgi:hypothetical protein
MKRYRDWRRAQIPSGGLAYSSHSPRLGFCTLNGQGHDSKAHPSSASNWRSAVRSAGKGARLPFSTFVMSCDRRIDVGSAASLVYNFHPWIAESLRDANNGISVTLVHTYPIACPVTAR